MAGFYLYNRQYVGYRYQALASNTHIQHVAYPNQYMQSVSCRQYPQYYQQQYVGYMHQALGFNQYYTRTVVYRGMRPTTTSHGRDLLHVCLNDRSKVEKCISEFSELKSDRSTAASSSDIHNRYTENGFKKYQELEQLCKNNKTNAEKIYEFLEEVQTDFEYGNINKKDKDLLYKYIN